MKSVRELAADMFPDRVSAFGAVRRMVVSLTSGVLWQLAGVRLLDGSTETMQAEPFSGIGFYSRPAASGSPEVIAIMVGGAKSPAIVALRDEKTRQAVAGNLQPGETMVFNAGACVYLKADGTVEIRSAGGVAAPLATKADLTALKTYLDGHVHTAPSGGGPTSPPTGASPAPAGTTKLKGE